MILFDLLKISLPEIDEKDCKVHLAVWNGVQNPVDVFLSGKFEEWQSWQNRKNFERKYIMSLLQLAGTDQWLFGGGFVSHSCEYIKSKNSFWYKTSELDVLSSLRGLKSSGTKTYAKIGSDCHQPTETAQRYAALLCNAGQSEFIRGVTE